MSDPLVKAVIFDLDGTLADHNHRISLAPYSLQGEHIHLENPEEAWRPYHEACMFDPAYEITANILLNLSRNYSILFATGRPEIYRHRTKLWLEHNRFSMYDVLLMREYGDLSSQADLKVKMAKHFRSIGYEIVMAFEDQPVVAKAYNDIGIATFLHSEGK